MSRTSVPPFKMYFASKEDMTAAQQLFFERWVCAWKRGNALPVNGNISYLYCYVYDILRQPIEEAATELRLLANRYGQLEPRFARSCLHWLADCHVVNGDIAGSLEIAPLPTLGSKASSQADTRLSLRLHLGQTPRAAELLALDGPSVTRWGRQHLDLVHAWIDADLKAESHPPFVSRLKDWATTAHEYRYSAFTGSFAQRSIELAIYSFSGVSEAVAHVRALIREAENTVREEKGIPRVGEGWVEETALYYQLKQYFSSMEVIQHARPKWLGKQHLDVFIPAVKIAVEYQGTQHDKPIEFFGGQTAWEATQKRDARKRQLCKAHGIRLIEVRPDFSFVELVEVILRTK